MCIGATPTTRLFVEASQDWLSAHNARFFFSAGDSVTNHATVGPPAALLKLTRSSVNNLTAKATFGIWIPFIPLSHSTSIPYYKIHSQLKIITNTGPILQFCGPVSFYENPPQALTSPAGSAILVWLTEKSV
jgi:hypothetical protein